MNFFHSGLTPNISNLKGYCRLILILMLRWGLGGGVGRGKGDMVVNMIVDMMGNMMGMMG